MQLGRRRRERETARRGLEPAQAGEGDRTRPPARRGGRGAVVRVLRGRVWLTEYGDRRDWALDRGAARRIEARGVAVLECAAPAMVEVLAPPPRGRATLAAARSTGRLALCLCVSAVRAALRRGNPA